MAVPGMPRNKDARMTQSSAVHCRRRLKNLLKTSRTITMTAAATPPMMFRILNILLLSRIGLLQAASVTRLVTIHRSEREHRPTLIIFFSKGRRRDDSRYLHRTSDKSQAAAMHGVAVCSIVTYWSSQTQCASVSSQPAAVTDFARQLIFLCRRPLSAYTTVPAIASRKLTAQEGSFA